MRVPGAPGQRAFPPIGYPAHRQWPPHDPPCERLSSLRPASPAAGFLGNMAGRRAPRATAVRCRPLWVTPRPKAQPYGSPGSLGQRTAAGCFPQKAVGGCWCARWVPVPSRVRPQVPKHAIALRPALCLGRGGHRVSGGSYAAPGGGLSMPTASRPSAARGMQPYGQPRAAAVAPAPCRARVTPMG